MRPWANRIEVSCSSSRSTLTSLPGWTSTRAPDDKTSVLAASKVGRASSDAGVTPPGGELFCTYVIATTTRAANAAAAK
jgi:hypothetical protein